VYLRAVVDPRDRARKLSRIDALWAGLTAPPPPLGLGVHVLADAHRDLAALRDEAYASAPLLYPEDVALARMVHGLLEAGRVDDARAADVAFLPFGTQLFAIGAPEHAATLVRALDAAGDRPVLVLDATDLYSRPGHEGDDALRALSAARKAALYGWVDDRVRLLTLDANVANDPRDLAILPFCGRALRPPCAEGARDLLFSFVGTLANPLWPPFLLRGIGAEPRWRRVEARAPGPAFLGTADEARARLGVADPYADVPARSVYGLCPRGYGGWTYRLSETIVSGAIPVILSDGFAPPFADRLPWETLALHVPERALDALPELLEADAPRRAERQAAIAAHQHHFTPSGVRALIADALRRRFGRAGAAADQAAPSTRGEGHR
jgi:hypothetical protein